MLAAPIRMPHQVQPLSALVMHPYNPFMPATHAVHKEIDLGETKPVIQDSRSPKSNPDLCAALDLHSVFADKGQHWLNWCKLQAVQKMTDCKVRSWATLNRAAVTSAKASAKQRSTTDRTEQGRH